MFLYIIYMNYEYEFVAVLFVFIIYWFFNIKNQDPISVNIPIENMKNISIFDGGELSSNSNNNELKSNSE